MMYVALLFNFGTLKAASSLRYLLELDLRQAPEYIAMGSLLILACSFALVFGPRVQAPASWSERILVLGALALIINISMLSASEARGSYKASAPSGTPVRSGILESGLMSGTVTARNVIVVLVESLGVPSNDHDRALFDKIWGAKRWGGRYTASYGTSPFFGTTTNAEMRELCGQWADYTTVDLERANCLPQRLARQGYEAVAMHSFRGSMFDRQDWYPLVGFGQRLFSDDLHRLGARDCGGVFPVV